MEDQNKNGVPGQRTGPEKSGQTRKRSEVREAGALAEPPSYKVLHGRVETVHDDAQKREQAMEGRLSRQISGSEGRLNTRIDKLEEDTKERDQAMEGRLNDRIDKLEEDTKEREQAMEARLNAQMTELKAQMNQLSKDVAAMNARLLNGFIATVAVMMSALFGAVSLLH